MCKCVLPPGDNPIAVNKYIISYSLFAASRKITYMYAAASRKITYMYAVSILFFISARLLLGVPINEGVVAARYRL